MIQANEIRVGNLVEWDDDEMKSDKRKVRVEAHHMNSVEFFNPIPLTEEILLKCGFEYDEIEARFMFYGTNECEYILEQQDDWHYVGIKHSRSINYFVWDIKYVHQLQNLYFALTGTELNIKL